MKDPEYGYYVTYEEYEDMMSKMKVEVIEKSVKDIVWDGKKTENRIKFQVLVYDFDNWKGNTLVAAERKSARVADKYCKDNGYNDSVFSYDNVTERKMKSAGIFSFHCTDPGEKIIQVKAIEKAGELCTNIGYTPNTDPYRGCIVELLKAEKSTTNVTVNQTKDYSEMINRGICMTTGNCDITGQPIIRQSQNTITNARCRVTGTGVWKTIQCF